MTYRFTVFYLNERGVLSKMKMREHSYKKLRKKFAELYPRYGIVSIAGEPTNEELRYYKHIG